MSGLSVTEKAKTINDLFEIVLSNSFPLLRICTAVGIEPLDLNEKWTGSPSIRHLILDGQTSVVYEKLNVLYSNLRATKDAAQILVKSQIGVNLFLITLIFNLGYRLNTNKCFKSRQWSEKTHSERNYETETTRI